MILLEREDVNDIGLDPYWFLVQWVPGSPEAMEFDYAEMPSPGPFLLKVNDEAAWISHGGDNDWRKVAIRYRYDCPSQRQWGALAGIYAEGIGITQMSFVKRWTSVRNRLKKTPDVWEDWQKIYRWPEGSDAMWSCVLHHPVLETREHEGRKEVRYVG